jgi:hypothetical protein
MRCANPAPVERFFRRVRGRPSRRSHARHGACTCTCSCSRRVCHGQPSPRAG